jgi:hypothetical protein
MDMRKKFEIQMSTWLTEEGLEYSYSNKKLPCAPTTRYPDYLFVAGLEHSVLLEVDEHEHVNYNTSCEIRRLSELMDSIGSMNLHVVRFNPHGKVKKEVLMAALKDAISTNLASFNDTGCVVQYVGYSTDRILELDNLTCGLQVDKFTTLELIK